MSVPLATAALLLSLAQLCVLAAPVPRLTGRVVDNAAILSPAAREQITAALEHHERVTGNQIAVLTVNTLDDESIERYATRVFDAWKLGQKDTDNGVLLVIAPKQRAMRIEVGYGLEGMLTDAAANRIVRDVVAPRFAESKFDEGVARGLETIIAVLLGNISADSISSISTKAIAHEQAAAQRWSEEKKRLLAGVIVVGVLILMTLVFSVVFGLHWFLYFSFLIFWVVFPQALIGGKIALLITGVYALGFPLARWFFPPRTKLLTETTSGHGGSDASWSSSSSSSSASSSSSPSSDSGFSGGGGSSGGGGASGKW